MKISTLIVLITIILLIGGFSWFQGNKYKNNKIIPTEIKDSSSQPAISQESSNNKQKENTPCNSDSDCQDDSFCFTSQSCPPGNICNPPIPSIVGDYKCHKGCGEDKDCNMFQTCKQIRFRNEKGDIISINSLTKSVLTDMVCIN